jgi:hypothetical protein
VFSRRRPGQDPHEYEVIIIRVEPAATFNGSDIPEREAYPSPRQWGKLGWSIPEKGGRFSGLGIVSENLTKPRKERTSWAELFSEFRKGVALRGYPTTAFIGLWRAFGKPFGKGISIYFLTTFSQKKDQAPAVLDDPQLPPREGSALIFEGLRTSWPEMFALTFLTCFSRKESAPALLDSETNPSRR